MQTTETPCRCVETDRGTDSSGCTRHNVDEPLILALGMFWDGPADE